ncbi:MAG: hypothetical protein QGF59_15870 [Pirellulaceae bacterium]|nr:hypothetical protein [Pirellulaceae bacterium]
MNGHPIATETGDAEENGPPDKSGSDMVETAPTGGSFNAITQSGLYEPNTRLPRDSPD